MFLHRAGQSAIGKKSNDRGGSGAAVSPWSLRRLGVGLIARRTWSAMSSDDLTGRSAQLAYYFFFSLFPGLVAASAVLGMVAASGRAFSSQLVEYLATVLPPSAFDIVLTTFNQTTHASSGGKLAFGVLAALWTASSGTSAIQDALNSIHKIKEERPFWKARLQAIALTVAIAIIFALALTVMLGGDLAAGYLYNLAKVRFLFTVLSRILSWPIAFALVSVAFALTYYSAPDIRNAKWRWLSPGSLAGILLWLLASTGLRFYLRFFNSYSVTYGSLGAVIVLLTWFYLSGLALLMGAEINVAIEAIAAKGKTENAQAATSHVPQA